VPNLKEGDEYQFRVIAVNDVGPSDPSRPSNSVLIEEEPNKPCMDLGGVRDITVRAGEDFSIHVPYVAFPKPTLTWFNNDTLLDESDTRVHQQVSIRPVRRFSCYINLQTVPQLFWLFSHRNFTSLNFMFCFLIITQII
jgi:hypothetical protein